MGCGCGLCPGPGNIKLRASLISAALFAIVASPQLFAFVQSLVGGLFRVASASGAPTLAGLALHSVVYGLIVYAFMHHKRRDGFSNVDKKMYCSYSKPFEYNKYQTGVPANREFQTGGPANADPSGGKGWRWDCPPGKA